MEITCEKERDFQQIWKLFEETNRRFKETEKQIKETDRKIDRLTGKWGRFVEGLVVPAAEELFKKRGIEVTSIYQRVKKRKDNERMEIDVLAVDTLYAILIEVKSTLGVSDVKEHIERIGKFKYFFPEYSDRKVLGAVAGIIIDEGSDRYAYQNGLFIIGQSGENVKILNDDDFKPKEW